MCLLRFYCLSVPQSSSTSGVSSSTPVTTKTTTATTQLPTTTTTTKPVQTMPARTTVPTIVKPSAASENNSKMAEPSSSCGPLDLSIIVDVSTGVGSTDNWTALTAFLASTVTHLIAQPPVGWSATINRLSVIAYSDKVSAMSPPGDANVGWLVDTLRAVKLSTSSDRNVTGALRTAQSLLANSGHTVILLVTTGGGTINSDQSLSAASALRQLGVQIVVLGVGSGVNGTEASLIGGSDTSVFYVDDWTKRSSSAVITGSLRDKMCSDSSSQPIAADAVRTLFSCSFETSQNTLCGLVQDTTDQFDWTIFNAPTPSDPTGPDFAYSGNWYVYIEASAPRQPNDRARLLFPNFNYNGTVCIDFHYHMYGFHINTLKLVQRLSDADVTVWMRHGNMGNTWYHGAVQIPLTSSTQLIFDASRGQEFSGDIGLDLITVATGPCPGSSS